jgi:hypothetical protein
MGIEFGNESQDIKYRGVFVNHDYGTGAEHGFGFDERIEIHLDINLVGS